MSSSDEDAVRRPGRSAGASRRQSHSENEEDNSPRMNIDVGGDDDADLFGSDGPDEDLDNKEYGMSLTTLPIMRS